MMNQLKLSFVLSASLLTFASLAQAAGTTATSTATGSGSGTHPCAAIKQACITAGFVQNEAKQGKGLWKDCVDPIIQGVPQPANSVIKLPTVDGNTHKRMQGETPDVGRR